MTFRASSCILFLCFVQISEKYYYFYNAVTDYLQALLVLQSKEGLE